MVDGIVATRNAYAVVRSAQIERFVVVMRRRGDGQSRAVGRDRMIEALFPGFVELEVRPRRSHGERDGQNEDLANILKNGAWNRRCGDERDAAVDAGFRIEQSRPNLRAIVIAKLGFEQFIDVVWVEVWEFALEECDPLRRRPVSQHVRKAPFDHRFRVSEALGMRYGVIDDLRGEAALYSVESH